MSDLGRDEDLVRDLLDRTSEQYEVYNEVARIVSLARLPEDSSQGELRIDTVRHPVGLVLNTGV